MTYCVGIRLDAGLALLHSVPVRMPLPAAVKAPVPRLPLQALAEQTTLDSQH